MRTKGSARFQPYYKVQWRDPISMTWRDVQKAHANVDSARAHLIAGKECRLMEISMDGRRILPH